MNKSAKLRLISVIHAQKNKAGLTDDEYRMVIFEATGKQSCKECNLQELKSIYYDLNLILSKKGIEKFFYTQNNQRSLVSVIISRAEKVMGVDYEKRIQGFLHKMKKKSLDDCTDQELRRLLGFINTISRKNA